MEFFDSSDDDYSNRRKISKGQVSNIVEDVSPSKTSTKNTTEDKSSSLNKFASSKTGRNQYSKKKRQRLSRHKKSRDDCYPSDSSSSDSIVDNETNKSQTEVSQIITVDVDEDDDDEERKTTAENENFHLGQRIAKEFNDGLVYFGKIVDAFEHESESFWHVSYDDGDSEDLDNESIKDALALYAKFQEQEFTDVLWFSKVVVLRHQFMVEKENFLSQLPMKIKENFLELGFARWARNYLPVMYLGPYDVSPGAIREEWMENYKKHKEFLDKMPRLVFWYGANIHKCFSFVDPKDCYSLSTGIERGFCKIPMDGNKEVISKPKRTTPMSKTWEAFMKDLPLPPKMRIGCPKLKENHELVEERLKLLSEVEAENRRKPG